MLLHLALSIIPLLGSVVSQTAAPYTDPDNGIDFVGVTDAVYKVTYGYVFPPINSTTTPNEFIGEIVAPTAVAWAGVSPGGGMVKQLLLVAWPNANTIVHSARYATTYAQPTVYAGPIITDLPSSKINSTHWKWVYRCQNCTAWDGGSLDTSSSGAPAWAASTDAVNTPSDSASTFLEHTDFGFFGINFANAHASQAHYDSWVAEA